MAHNSSVKRRPPAYRLTHDLAAEYGGAVLCIDERAFGHRYRLYSRRPGPSLNAPVLPLSDDVVEPDGIIRATQDLVEESVPPAVVRVDIRGPIEQRASFHECECGGWSDGHDAIAERLIAALETSDVLMVVESPGGAHAGLQEAVRLVLREKEIHGRRVTGFVDELCGSAAFWWMACVCDEIYIPESGMIGSIGARAGHESIAGMLAHEGREVTYFAWPGPGKVAFAPEIPLSDLGKQRGNRDVAMAGEAFAAAVGPRRGLTRDEIVDLNADVLTGFAAVKAKLADSVASLDEVLEYALAQASRGETMKAIRTEEDPRDPKTPEQARNEEPQKPGHPEPDGDEPDGDEEDEGDDPKPETPPERAKFCDKCGSKMKYEDEAEEPDGDEDDDDPESEDTAARNQPPPPEQDREAAASIAGIFGLRSTASLPAVKSVAIAHRKLAVAVMRATGAKGPSAALGALRALIDDAAESAKLRDLNKSLRSKDNHRERMDLLNRLASANLPGYTRGELFTDAESNGKRTVSPAPQFSEMKLSTLRGLVEAKTKGKPVFSASPFNPNTNAAKHATIHGIGNDVKENNPDFIRDAAATSTATPDQIADSFAALKAHGVI